MKNKNKGEIKKDLPSIIQELSSINDYFESLEKNTYLHIDMNEKYTIPIEDKLKEIITLVNQFWVNMK